MSSDMEQRMQSQIEGSLIDEAEFRKRLHRLYGLGQRYWSEADSESYAANKRSLETDNKAMALIDELMVDIAARK